MDSASISFIAFGLTAALMSNIRKSPLWRAGVLLAASIVFLFLLSPNPLGLLPLFGFLALGYIGMNLVRRGVQTLTVVVLLVILAFAYLKRYSFLPHSTFLSIPYLALGLSYIFFRVLHLVVDAADPEGTRVSGIFAYLTYTLNFTTFVSGPIQRYEDFVADQFTATPPALDLRVIGLQTERLVRGFFKVNVLAVLLNTIRLDSMARLTQQLPNNVKLSALVTLTAIYPLWLYSNFSGYIDIVISLARLMRIRLPENFDRPFSATSFIEFWNRWHITLSSWLKHYVYNPLLMSLMRRIPSRAMEPFLGVVCFFVTFFLIGIWHGRTSEFAMYGVLQGGGLALNKLWQILLTRQLGRKGYRTLSANPIYEVFARGLTYTWFAFTLFWFWGSWGDLKTVFTSISASSVVLVFAVVWLAASIVLAVWEAMLARLISLRIGDSPVFVNRYARMIYLTSMGFASFVMVELLVSRPPEIVYKAF